MTIPAIIIPFRDRGTDWRRAANLHRVRQHIYDSTGVEPMMSSDGDLEGSFNRSRAYNNGVRDWQNFWNGQGDVFIFHEADMMLAAGQLRQAAEMALEFPGLVVPFDEYRYLSDADSDLVRSYLRSPLDIRPESVMTHGKSIGAINVVSRHTLNLIGGFDEAFDGNWYDDDAMKIAFEVGTGHATRFVKGPAYHLYHLPGWKGDHLTDEDRAATRRNKNRLDLYKAATTPERIRELTAGGQ